MGENTQLLDRLYIGPAPKECGDFTLIVLCAQEYQPRSSEMCCCKLIHAGIDDGNLTPREARIAENASDLIAQAWKKGEKILVTCMMGRNRSALVSALAIAKINQIPRPIAAQYVRSRRRDALGVQALQNRTFLAYLTQ